MTKARDVASNGGLVLLNSTTFSGSSAVQVNNVFSTTYDSYVMRINMYGSVGQYPRLQLSSGGTASTSSYGYGATYFDTSGNNATSNYSNNSSASYGEIPFIGTTSTIYSLIDFTIMNPALALDTSIRGMGLQAGTARNFFVYHNSAVAYDGIKIYPSSGTITGSLQIYGCKK